MEYYSAFKNKETLPFAKTQIKLKNIELSEIRHIHKAKFMISPICGNHNSQTSGSRWQNGGCQGLWREMGKYETSVQSFVLQGEYILEI